MKAKVAFKIESDVPGLCERMVTSLITYVGNKNFNVFAPLLPVESIHQAQAQNQLIFGAVDGETACGALILSADSTRSAIEYLFVARDYRLRGHGSELLQKALSFASGKGIAETVIHFDPDEHQGIDILLLKEGFAAFAPEARFFVCTLEALLSSKSFAEKADRVPANVVPVKNVPVSWIRRFCQNQSRDNFFFDAIDPQNIDGDISTVVTAENGITGAVWVSGSDDGFTVDGMFFSSPANAAAYIYPVLQAVLHAAARKLPKSVPVSFAAVNPATEKIVKKLFPDVSFFHGRIVSEKYRHF